MKYGHDGNFNIGHSRMHNPANDGCGMEVVFHNPSCQGDPHHILHDPVGDCNNYHDDGRDQSKTQVCLGSVTDSNYYSSYVPPGIVNIIYIK
jgi:hypothetical protein